MTKNHASRPIRPRPLVIGLLGGVGAGKSTVARLLGEQGAAILDADRVARELLDTPEVRDELVARFGEDVLGTDGRVSRPALAERVFGAGRETERRWLESLTHPRVRSRLRADLEALLDAPVPPPLVVLDVPLLVEGPVASWCDRLVFVDAPTAARAERCARDRGWAPEEIDRREAVQAALEEKRRRAHFVVLNDRDLAGLSGQVLALFRRLTTSPVDAP